MARNVRDVATLFEVLSATAPPTGSRPTPTFAFASSWTIGHQATDELVASTIESLRESGLSIVDRFVPTPGNQEYADEFTVLTCELVDDLSAYLRDRPGDGVRSLADVIAYENEHADIEMPYFGHESFDIAQASGGRQGNDYGPARERNLTWARDIVLTPGLADVDVLLAASYGPAWKSDLIVGGHPNIASCVTMAPAIAGWPILSLPIGYVHGLPVSIGMVARPHDEWRLLEAAAVVESALRGGAPFDRPTWVSPSRG